MIEYYNEDCLAGMARYPDKHFDLAIVDLYAIKPFGIPHNIGKIRAFVSNGTYPGVSIRLTCETCIFIWPSYFRLIDIVLLNSTAFS